MGWSYPDISQEDLMTVIKGFVDMLVLASGYQSSGRLSHWDSLNIKKAFQWATFLENVLRCLRSSADYQDSMAELNAALSELTSNPYFPQGLRHISTATLSQARDLMLKHLIHTLPLRDKHLRASVAAIIEMDKDEIHDASKDFILTGTNGFTGNRSFASSDTLASKSMSSLEGSFTKCAAEELGRRHHAVYCISAAETGLDVLSEMIRKSNIIHDPGTTLCKEEQQRLATFITDKSPIEPAIWSHWKSRSLSYLFKKRTIRLVSGANLLFSAPKDQWVRVIEEMSIQADANDFYEKIELLLLGSIGHKWSSLIEKLMSSSYECLTISKIYQEVKNFLSGRMQNLSSEDDMFPEEKGALEYLEGLLSNQYHKLWKLLPVLPAMAIPSRSMLFRSYLIELENQMRGDSSAIRCCSCIMNGKNHRECEIAESIWCLYIFHVCGSCLMKIQILKWGRRIAGSGSAITLGSVQRKIPIKYFQGSYVAKQLVWWLKSQWKPALSLRWQRSSTRYSYDACSYSQNFDDGCSNDHRSPLAPR